METLDGLSPPLFAQPMLYWLANIVSSGAFADYKTVEQVLEEAGDLKEARDPDGTEEATKNTQIMGSTGLRLGFARGFFGCFRYIRYTSCDLYAS